MLPAIDESLRGGEKYSPIENNPGGTRGVTPRTPEEEFLTELMQESGGVPANRAEEQVGHTTEASFSDFLSGDMGDDPLTLDTFSL